VRGSSSAEIFACRKRNDELKKCWCIFSAELFYVFAKIMKALK
jgi:hypothetical protein